VIAVRREKALVHSGKKARPGTGSFPGTIGAAVKVTKPSVSSCTYMKVIAL
jgi:hypothetical protein